jgi:hypothetical protein
MDFAEKIAARMPVSVIGADESTKIAAIRDVMGEFGQTPHQISTTFLLDEDFIPDTLAAFRYRVECEIVSQERAV